MAWKVRRGESDRGERQRGRERKRDSLRDIERKVEGEKGIDRE